MFPNWFLCVILFCAFSTEAVLCTQTFYKLVGSAHGASVANEYVPFLAQSFFTCGSNEDCTKVAKFKGSSRHSELLDQKAITDDAIVYEKVSTPKTEDPSWSEWHPMMCSTNCGGGKRTLVRYCYSSLSCKGSSRMEANCNTDSCPDLLNCTYNAKTFSPLDGLLHGNPSCHSSDSGAIMTAIQLEKRETDIRYNFSCCGFKDAICHRGVKLAPTIDCGAFGFIISFPREKEINGNRYLFNCCELVHSKWRGRMRCVENATQFVESDASLIDTLTRIPIQCPAGFGLSMLKLNGKAAEIKLQVIFRCCHVAY